ncbi:MAG: hypothetical protein WAK83_28130, partial [Trebonia sp.]|uniref:hypothetical protein n=1 Tax=Trebonia sp. TaxID=2767075 RepID=UPI003BAFCB47
VDTTSAGRETTAPTSAAHSSAPAQSPSQTCRAYYSYYKHQEGLSYWATQRSLWDQLIKLTGTDNRFKVYQYCARYMEDLFPAGTPGAGPDQAPAHTGPGSQDNGKLGQQAGAPANSRNGSGNGQASNGQGDPPGSGSNP